MHNEETRDTTVEGAEGKAIEAPRKKHRLAGRMVVSSDGRGKYRIADDGSLRRLNPKDSKKGRRKAAQRERRRRLNQH